MNKQATTSNRGVLLRFIKATFMAGLLPALVLRFSPQTSQAGSATWNLNPASNDWNTAANWTPATVPNGATDTATFATSNIVSVSLSADTEVSSITFSAGPNAFTIATGDTSVLTLSGAGIINNSGVAQNFAAEAGSSSYGLIVFSQNASAGTLTKFTSEGSPYSPAVILFVDNSTAGSGKFTNTGSAIAFQTGGYLQFGDNSSAENAVLINEGGSIENAVGGQIGFRNNATAANAVLTNDAGPTNTTGNTGGGSASFADNATAGNATIINNGSTLNGGTGGLTYFGGTPGLADAASATLIANGGSNGGAGGQIVFASSSTGGRSRIEVFGNGTFDFRSQEQLTVGSIEGNGLVLLGPALTIGSNNLSTIFSGTIQESGSLTKIGSGTLTLTGDNAHTGGTFVSAGNLFVANRNGSGTGTGPVQVNAGNLGGVGKIAGSVTIGTGGGPGAFLTPGTRPNVPATLTIRKNLRFRADGTFHFSYKSSNRTADKIVARGVTIDSGAELFFDPLDTGALTPGTVFIAISNTAATSITGTFSNLPDGATVTVGGNTFQANYEGGDGNDLTLTVVP